MNRYHLIGLITIVIVMVLIGFGVFVGKMLWMYYKALKKYLDDDKRGKNVW